MKKVTISRMVCGQNTFYFNKFNDVYLRPDDPAPIAASNFTVRELLEMKTQYAAKDPRGGAAIGSGRKKMGGLKLRSVKLTDAQHNYLVKKYGSFTEAVRSLLPGIEFADMIGATPLD